MGPTSINADRIMFHMNMAERESLWRKLEALSKRTLKQRIDCGFIKTYKPVLDAIIRSFEILEE